VQPFEVSVTGEQIDPLLPRRRRHLSGARAAPARSDPVLVSAPCCAAKAQFCWQTMRLIVKIWPLALRDTR
jgi:hypothetical protein